MPHVTFTPNLQRHITCRALDVSGATVRAALEQVFVTNPGLRAYLLDDQGRLRRHVTIFVDTYAIVDRDSLTDAVNQSGEIYVVQALSGG